MQCCVRCRAILSATEAHALAARLVPCLGAMSNVTAAVQAVEGLLRLGLPARGDEAALTARQLVASCMQRVAHQQHGKGHYGLFYPLIITPTAAAKLLLLHSRCGMQLKGSSIDAVVAAAVETLQGSSLTASQPCSNDITPRATTLQCSARDVLGLLSCLAQLRYRPAQPIMSALLRALQQGLESPLHLPGLLQQLRPATAVSCGASTRTKPRLSSETDVRCAQVRPIQQQHHHHALLTAAQPGTQQDPSAPEGCPGMRLLTSQEVLRASQCLVQLRVAAGHAWTSAALCTALRGAGARFPPTMEDSQSLKVAARWCCQLLQLLPQLVGRSPAARTMWVCSNLPALEATTELAAAQLDGLSAPALTAVVCGCAALRCVAHLVAWGEMMRDGCGVHAR